MNIKHSLSSIAILIHFFHKSYRLRNCCHFYYDDARYTNNAEQFKRKKTF